MFEDHYKYCPRCLDEYRPEIQFCAACHAALKSGDEMNAAEEDKKERLTNRSGELSSDDDLVAVRRGPLSEMKVYEKLLLKEKIGAMLAGDENSCGKGCCAGNFDLVVRRDDAPDAVQIIEGEIRRTSLIDTGGEKALDYVFDPLSAENRCPACGHGFSGGTECPDCGLCF